MRGNGLSGCFLLYLFTALRMIDSKSAAITGLSPFVSMRKPQCPSIIGSTVPQLRCSMMLCRLLHTASLIAITRLPAADLGFFMYLLPSLRRSSCLLMVISRFSKSKSALVKPQNSLIRTPVPSNTMNQSRCREYVLSLVMKSNKAFTCSLVSASRFAVSFVSMSLSRKSNGFSRIRWFFNAILNAGFNILLIAEIVLYALPFLRIALNHRRASISFTSQIRRFPNCSRFTISAHEV